MSLKTYVCPVCKKSHLNMQTLSDCIDAHIKDDETEKRQANQKRAEELSKVIDTKYTELCKLTKEFNEIADNPQYIKVTYECNAHRADLWPWGKPNVKTPVNKSVDTSNKDKVAAKDAEDLFRLAARDLLNESLLSPLASLDKKDCDSLEDIIHALGKKIK